MKQEEKAIILNTRDNVATALADLKAGSSLELDVDDRRLTVKLTTAVPFGHKFSLTQIESGAPVIKYGEIMGTATSTIHAGDYVHVHNVISVRGRSEPAGGTR